MTAEIKAYLGIGIALILAAVVGWYTVHERGIEHKKDVAADNTALAVAHKEAVAETDANIAKANTADLGADHDQQVIDAYRAAHPEQPVRLCHAAGDSVAGVRPVGAADGRAQSAGAGSAAIPEMPAGTAGPDIRPGLDALVRAAGRLDVLYADRQQRQ
jgi:hypothetical protein